MFTATHVGINVRTLVIEVTRTPLYFPRGEEVNKALSASRLLRRGARASGPAEPLPPILCRKPASALQDHRFGLTHLVA